MKITDEAVSVAAKAIADEIGHGMREKHYDHARAALEAALPHLSQGSVTDGEHLSTRIIELETDLEVANDKLRVANSVLEPFSLVDDELHGDLPDDTPVSIRHEKLLDLTLTLADFRRARAAIGGQSNS